MRYRRGFSSGFSDTRVRPSFLLTAPARNPRTLCCCQPVAACSSSIVAPPRRQSRSRQLCCLVCFLIAGLVLVRLATAPFLRACRFGLAFVVPPAFFACERCWHLAGSTASTILVSLTGLDLGIGWSSMWASAPHARRSHHPKPRHGGEAPSACLLYTSPSPRDG